MDTFVRGSSGADDAYVFIVLMAVDRGFKKIEESRGDAARLRDPIGFFGERTIRILLPLLISF